MTFKQEGSPPDECVSSDSLPEVSTSPSFKVGKGFAKPSPLIQQHDSGKSTTKVISDDCVIAQWPSGTSNDPILVPSEEYVTPINPKKLKTAKSQSVSSVSSPTCMDNVNKGNNSKSSVSKVDSSFVQNSPHPNRQEMESPQSNYMYSPFPPYFMPQPPHMHPFYGNPNISGNATPIPDPNNPYSSGYYPLYSSQFMSPTMSSFHNANPSHFPTSQMVSAFHGNEGMMNVPNVNTGSITSKLPSVKTIPKEHSDSKTTPQTKVLTTKKTEDGQKKNTESGIEGVTPLDNIRPLTLVKKDAKVKPTSIPKPVTFASSAMSTTTSPATPSFPSISKSALSETSGKISTCE